MFLLWFLLPAFCLKYIRKRLQTFHISTSYLPCWRMVMRLDMIFAVVAFSLHILQLGSSVSPHLNRLIGDDDISITDRSNKEILIGSILQISFSNWSMLLVVALLCFFFWSFALFLISSITISLRSFPSDFPICGKWSIPIPYFPIQVLPMMSCNVNILPAQVVLAEIYVQFVSVNQLHLFSCY